jgi:hypothetical protein
LSGDGILTQLCGGGAAAIVFAREWERLDRIAVAGLGGLTTLIAVQVLTGLTATLGPVTPSVTPSAGIGLYLTVVAGLVMLGAGVNGYMNLEDPAAKAIHGER